MSYQDELRAQAMKRSKKNHRIKMIWLVIFLIMVFYAIHFLGAETEKIKIKKEQIKAQTNQQEILPGKNETE